MAFGQFSYWAFLGTIYLCVLTWQDYKNNMMVDDRKNYFMLGATVSLVSLVSLKLWYLLVLLIFLMIFQVWGKKQKAFGEADINSFSWIFLGLGIINPYKLFAFVLFLAVAILIYTGFKLYVFKYKGETPFYGVILVCFVVSAWFMGLY